MLGLCPFIWLKSKQAAPIGHTPGKDRRLNRLASVALIHEPGQRLENKQGGLIDSSLVVFLPISFRCASKMQCCCVIEVVFRIRDDQLPSAARGARPI
jgi:hypothetical protein